MPRSSNIEKPLRMIAGHEKAIKKAASKQTRERISRKTYSIIKETVYSRVDARARANEAAFHHLYEWGRSGDDNARLFKLVSSKRGTAAFTMSYEFLPSKSPVPNSGHVFVDKARVMEEGQPVVIEPKDADALVFDVDGRTVATRGPIVVDSPGGPATTGTLRSEFMRLTQASSLLKNPVFQQMLQDEARKSLMEASRQ